jgi:hypothetical protein
VSSKIRKSTASSPSGRHDGRYKVAAWAHFRRCGHYKVAAWAHKVLEKIGKDSAFSQRYTPSWKRSHFNTVFPTHGV